MMNEFVPALVSIGILAGVFLYGLISDLRRNQRHKAVAQSVEIPTESAVEAGAGEMPELG
jgi:hypothetical protein